MSMYQVGRQVAYRGKMGCQSLSCTRNFQDHTRCYGWHCVDCHEPCDSQGGHRCLASQELAHVSHVDFLGPLQAMNRQFNPPWHVRFRRWWIGNVWYVLLLVGIAVAFYLATEDIWMRWLFGLPL